jgi:hypothetical protein
MEKQLLAIVVVFLFCLLYTAAIAAQTKGATEAKTSPDIHGTAVEPEARGQVQKLGFGRRIDVKLKDGSRASGRITGVAADRFVVTNAKGAATSFSYTEVSHVSKQKEKLGIFHQPWVAIMFTAAGVGTLIVLALQFFD